MAGSLTPTDDSRTLSASSFMSDTTSYSTLTAALTRTPHEFLQPVPQLRDAALQLAKHYIDPLIKTRKDPPPDALDAVYLEGFEVDQVWEQVRGVVVGVESVVAVASKTGEGVSKKRKAVMFVGSDSGSQSEGDEEGERESEGEDEQGDESEDEEMVDTALEDIQEEDEEETEEDGGGEEVYDVGSEDESDEEDEEKEYVKDVHGLNDGFFSIDEFNRQTELSELQDSRPGRPMDEDDDEDEDEIDLHADPSEWPDDDDEDDRVAQDDDGDEDMRDDYQDSDDGLDLDAEGNGDASDIMYKDFFAPPPKKARKPGEITKKSNTRSWRGQPANSDSNLEAIESDMARVRRDLFDEDEEEGSKDEGEDPADPRSRRSTHEKRVAALQTQIRQLEQANIAKREWVLAGEAAANSRPQNSLLEQDLEFERAGKPVPVITVETTESLEDLIKRRILAGQFDEVVKRRPEEAAASIRRGKAQINDAKPTQSLAEVYETEVMKKGEDKVDEKLQKEHDEISELWANVSRKLDALTNWHYTPKPPKAALTVVADTAAIEMEEAQPSTAVEAAETGRLAPQEVYKPGFDKAFVPETGGAREIVKKGGAPVSTREMTSDERRRRRRREKERIRKSGKGKEVKEGAKKDVIDTLRRGGVTIVGKDGVKRNVDGDKLKEKRPILASQLKL